MLTEEAANGYLQPEVLAANYPTGGKMILVDLHRSFWINVPGNRSRVLSREEDGKRSPK